MKFYSTNHQSDPVSFRESVYQSLPPDNGLYFPETITDLREIDKNDSSLQELGFRVMSPFVGDDIPANDLQTIIRESLKFEIPLVNVNNNIFSLELFHGPTYAFKDVGARFLARCLGYFNSVEHKELTILVATSGDTGGAVASGFHKVEGVEVIKSIGRTMK
jgi:threonine synthase